MFHDSLSESFLKCCGMIGHNTEKQSNVSQFSPKKISFWSNMGAIRSKITQLVLTARQVFRSNLA